MGERFQGGRCTEVFPWSCSSPKPVFPVPLPPAPRPPTRCLTSLHKKQLERKRKRTERKEWAIWLSAQGCSSSPVETSGHRGLLRGPREVEVDPTFQSSERHLPSTNRALPRERSGESLRGNRARPQAPAPPPQYIKAHRLHFCPPNSTQKLSAPPNAELGLGSLCESFELCHCPPCLARCLKFRPSRTQLRFTLAQATTGVSESRRSPSPPPASLRHSSPFPPFSSAASACAPHQRGWGLVLRERTPFPPPQHLHSPGRPPPPPPASGASPPGWAGGAQRPGNRLHGLTCSAAASRRPAAPEGGSRSVPASAGLPGSLLGAVGEPRAGRQRWSWLRAETAATRLRNPSG